MRASPREFLKPGTTAAAVSSCRVARLRPCPSSPILPTPSPRRPVPWAAKQLELALASGATVRRFARIAQAPAGDTVHRAVQIGRELEKLCDNPGVGVKIGRKVLSELIA
jgi:hypothetical protein